MSFKPMVSTGSDPKFYGNAQAFATKQEAEDSAHDLFNRWTLCTGHKAEESDEPVNYVRVDGHDKMINRKVTS